MRTVDTKAGGQMTRYVAPLYGQHLFHISRRSLSTRNCPKCLASSASLMTRYTMTVHNTQDNTTMSLTTTILMYACATRDANIQTKGKTHPYSGRIRFDETKTGFGSVPVKPSIIFAKLKPVSWNPFLHGFTCGRHMYVIRDIQFWLQV